ncbi:acsA [Symbiodinium microadriaticum]|nr:acsA [Symbiodinium microadriaticum]
MARQLLEIDWNGQDGKTFATELRQMTVYHVDGAQVIDFDSELTAKADNLKVDGDPQHAGFQYRATQHVPDKTAKQTYYVRPDGKGEPGKFRNWPGNKDHINLEFNALSFVAFDQRYTCCYLDSPKNPKPARFSERDYGRFGSYFATEVTEDNALELNYRLWLQLGEMSDVLFMSDGKTGQIDNVMHESRLFPPSEEFASKARVKSVEEYEQTWNEAQADLPAFWDKFAKEELHWFSLITKYFSGIVPTPNGSSVARPTSVTTVLTAILGHRPLIKQRSSGKVSQAISGR